MKQKIIFIKVFSEIKWYEMLSAVCIAQSVVCLRAYMCVIEGKKTVKTMSEGKHKWEYPEVCWCVWPKDILLCVLPGPELASDVFFSTSAPLHQRPCFKAWA